MKVLIFLSVLLISLESYAQNHDLSQMTEKARTKYLVKLAKEVTNNFGPGWLQGKIHTSVSPLKEVDSTYYQSERMRPYIGRNYYEVTFVYDEKTKKEVGWWYASQVQIWEDSGEPEGVMFGHDYGINFLDRPYRTWVKEGIGPNDQMKFEKVRLQDWVKYYGMVISDEPHNLRKMKAKERNEYLYWAGQKVTQEFGPGWYNDSLKVRYSKLKTFTKKDFGTGGIKEKQYGRKYYTVTFFNEPKEDEPMWEYASEVGFWADDGKPMGVIYGCGTGNQFYAGPTYQEILKSGIPQEAIIPFKPFKEVVGQIRQSIKGEKDAQQQGLSKMQEEARNEYLIKTAKEVAMAFAPEWMQWEVTPQVSQKHKYYSNNQRPDIQQNVGREYYAVTFYYNDETKAAIKYDYAAIVRIWVDSGEVADIGAGDWVKSFLGTSYEQMKKEGIQPEDQLHFEPIDGKLALSQMTEEARNEYLLKKSKEVVLNFGPEWYQEPMTTTIHGPREYHGLDSRSQKYNGRQCYFVSYYYDKYKNTGNSRAFTVCLWEEDGEPEGIEYGNEHGQAFFGSYNKMVKDGIKKEQQMPFWKGYYDHKDIYTDY